MTPLAKTTNRDVALVSQKDDPTPTDNLYRVMHDVELLDRDLLDGGLLKRVLKRMKKRDPEVFLLHDISGEPITKDVPMTRDIQEMMFALYRHGAPSQNLKRAKKKWRVVYDFMRAFSNGTGFNDSSDPRRDYISGLDLNKRLPAFDKARVCGGATITGQIVGDRLKVETLTDAMTLEHLLNNPHLYFHAMLSGKNPAPFPQGDGEPVLIPLIAPNGIDAYYPLERLEKVDEIADPYFRT